jgi:O-antigen ligase
MRTLPGGTSADHGHRRDRAVFIALLVLLVWLPLPLGSNRVWSMALMQAALALLGLWWLACCRARRRRLTALRRAAPVLWLFVLWLAYGLAQALPWPRPLVELAAPAIAAAYDAADAAPGAWLPLSLDPHASLALWFQSLALVTLFVLLLVLVDSRHRLRLLAQVLVLAAVAQAMLASVAALSGRDLWFIDAIGHAHGTYPNRNHLAGYLTMSLALGIGLLLADMHTGPPPAGWRQRLRGWLRVLLGRKARLRIFLAILVITLVLTGSRMGNIAFFAGLFIASAVGILLYRRRSRPVVLLLGSLLAVDVLILGGWFGLDRVQQRIAETVLVEETRYHLDVRAGGYIADFALTGSGGGSFASVFPGYRDASLAPQFAVHAHNDHLEFLLEYGAIGLALLGAIVMLTLAAALRVLARRHDPLARGMAFAALMGITALLIHILADFNLRIPANAALFVVLLALPWIGLALPAGVPVGAASAATGASVATRAARLHPPRG